VLGPSEDRATWRCPPAQSALLWPLFHTALGPSMSAGVEKPVEVGGGSFSIEFWGGGRPSLSGWVPNIICTPHNDNNTRHN
jgi:hypothetical protein